MVQPAADLAIDEALKFYSEWGTGDAVSTHVRGRSALWSARIATLSVFGPYVAGSVRVEQVIVLAMVAGIAVAGWPVMARRPFHPFPILLTWVGLCVVMAIGTAWRAPDLGGYGSQSASHGFAAFVMPLAFMVVTWFWTLTADTADLIRDIARIIVALMTVNSLIAVAQLVSGKAQISSLLPHFWAGSSTSASVAAAASGNGRFTGIFNQPANVGIAYGVALFCLIYLTRRAVRPQWKLVWLAGGLLLVGGALSVSKMFILGAVPIAAVVVARRQRARFRVIAAAAFSGAALWVLGALHVLPAWPAGTAAAKGLVSASSLTSQVTGLRYGSGGSLGPVIADVLKSAPWTGFGAAGLNTPYDSLWAEALVVAGIIGAALMATVLVLLWLRWWRQRDVLSPAQRSLAGATLTLAIGASLGIPSVTSDPAAALLWLIMGVLITGQPTRPRATPEQRREQAGPINIPRQPHPVSWLTP
jgi:hypothetical protein